jgi:glucose/mannose transport system substrate-binding protein
VGSFGLVVDGFGLPSGAPGRDATLRFLETILTPEGQQAFNPIKGSIPARSDLDDSIYDEISRKMMADLAQDTLVPSAVHGSAAPDAFMSDWTDVIHRFLYTGDVEQTARELDARAVEHGLVQ